MEVPAPQHTGRTTLSDEQKCVAILMGLAAGLSRRKIRTHTGCHMRTIDNVEKAAMAGGKLEPLNERVKEQVQRLLLDSIAEAREHIDEGARGIEGAAWLKAIATMNGVAMQNNQLATGQATEILVTKEGARREEADAWMRDKWADVIDVSPSPESESGERGGKAEQLAVFVGPESRDESRNPVGSGGAGGSLGRPAAGRTVKGWGVGCLEAAGGAGQADGSKGVKIISHGSPATGEPTTGSQSV